MILSSLLLPFHGFHVHTFDGTMLCCPYEASSLQEASADTTFLFCRCECSDGYTGPIGHNVLPGGVSDCIACAVGTIRVWPATHCTACSAGSFMPLQVRTRRTLAPAWYCHPQNPILCTTGANKTVAANVFRKITSYMFFFRVEPLV